MNELTKIHSEKIKYKVESILKNGHPQHKDRLWLVGFLNYAGYTLEEIMGIIEQGNQWLDYDKSFTRYQVESTILGAHRRVPFAKGGDARIVEPRGSISPLPKAFEQGITNLNLGMVKCRYSGCRDYGTCHHSRIHSLEAERIGSSYFYWCGCCPIQEVRCLSIDFDGAKELYSEPKDIIEGVTI